MRILTGSAFQESKSTRGNVVSGRVADEGMSNGEVTVWHARSGGGRPESNERNGGGSEGKYGQLIPRNRLAEGD